MLMGQGKDGYISAMFWIPEGLWFCKDQKPRGFDHKASMLCNFKSHTSLLLPIESGSRKCWEDSSLFGKGLHCLRAFLVVVYLTTVWKNKQVENSDKTVRESPKCSTNDKN